MKKDRRILLLLKGITCLLFLGRAYQHLRWDAPFRTLLWDQQWMEGIVKGVLGMDWTDYATNPMVDKRIQLIIAGFGIFYLVCAGMSLLVGIKKAKRISAVFMILGSLSLFFLAFLFSKERFFQAGQFLEYAIQWSLPLFLWQVAYRQNPATFWMKCAIAATFVGHGLYALNIYPVPGDYIEMTLHILGGTESGARVFLAVMGVLDLIASIGIFWKGKEGPFLVYAIFWGFATALARVMGHFYGELPMESLDLWTYEVLVRLGHGGLPLVLLFVLKDSNKHIDG